MTVPVIVAAETPADGGAPDAALPLVLGPSLGTTSAVWERSRPLLAARHRLLAWDLPGHGSSPPAAAPFTMPDLAEAVLRAADAAGIDRFAHAGVSLGGLVGLQLALRHPDRVAAVAMICSLPKIGTAEGWASRAADVRALGTPSLVTGSASRWFTPAFLDREPEIASRVLHGLLDIDDESYALCADALGETDLRDEVAGLAAPLTLIVGDSDPVVTVDEARAVVAVAPRGALHVMADTSHLATIEHPAEVSGILLSETSIP